MSKSFHELGFNYWRIPGALNTWLVTDFHAYGFDDPTAERQAQTIVEFMEGKAEVIVAYLNEEQCYEYRTALLNAGFKALGPEENPNSGNRVTLFTYHYPK